jgi:hydroxymethylpyrimidine pyrophosphatase-like HAD family hydrolase
MTVDRWQQIRLVATDMDGTLTQAGKFTPELLQSLVDLQTAGIAVVIVTGRSAGWVQGIASYLPIVGAIAENGGLFYWGDDPTPHWLVSIPDLGEHRQQLHTLFSQLQTTFPHLKESADNRFRLTDWTFDVQGVSPLELQAIGDRCQQQGWGFTYSTVQGHIKRPEQDKGVALETVLKNHFAQYEHRDKHQGDRHYVLTIGDSPNDESLFHPQRFPLSIGVANIQHYLEQMTDRPAYVTAGSEAAGFCEVARLLYIHQR